MDRYLGVPVLPGGKCQTCNQHHPDYSHSEVRSSMLEYGVSEEYIDSMQQRSIQEFNPRRGPGRPPVYVSTKDRYEKKTQQNRDKMARYRARLKAQQEGNNPPDWAEKRNKE